MENAFDYAAITAVMESQIAMWLVKASVPGAPPLVVSQYRDMASGVLWAWDAMSRNLPGFLCDQWLIDNDRLWGMFSGSEIVPGVQ